MKLYVVLQMTYDYYQFEQFLGACASEEGAIDLAAAHGQGKEIVMEGEPPQKDGSSRHDELANEEMPHMLIIESELHE